MWSNKNTEEFNGKTVRQCLLQHAWTHAGCEMTGGQEG